MKKQVKIFLAVVIAVICGGAALWSLLKPVAVETEILQLGAFAREFTVQGAVMPGISQVLTARASGVVVGLPYKIGMKVAAGETVADIAGAGQAERDLQLAQLRQQLSLARQNYLSLYGPQGGAVVRLEAARTGYEAALWAYEAAAKVNGEIPGTYTAAEINNLQSLLAAAKQGLSLAENENSAGTKAFYQEQIASWEEQIDTLEQEIRIEPVSAPFDGILWEAYVEEGAYVAKFQPVAKLYRQEDMIVEAALLTEDATALQTGGAVTCSLAGGAALPGEIRYISTVAEKTFSVIGIEESRNLGEIAVPGLPAFAGAGHQADVEFRILLAAQALTVPASALAALETGGEGVYLIRDGQAVLAPITTGRKAGGRVEILDGAAAGDVLILDPYDSGVRPGSRVAAAG